MRTKKTAKASAAATKTAAGAASSEVAKLAAARDVKRERRDIETKLLVPAPWNPRGKITPESVADIVASIPSVGIIEPIVAMASADGKSYIIIAGHRRVKAAEIAKLATVPCEVMVGIDATTAKHMTYIENLQRKDPDPILESKLVAELVADGMTTDEIAAEIGRDRKWVLRRKNLSKLSPTWRKRIESGEKITTDCLEHVAAYPIEIQDKLKSEGKYRNGTIRWEDVARSFSYETQTLRDAPFCTTNCRTCAKNSGCAPELFDWDGRKPSELGNCMDRKCFNSKRLAFMNETVKAAKAAGVTVIESRPSYDLQRSPKKTKVCTVLHDYKDYSGERCLEWAEPAKDKKAASSPKKSAAERKAAQCRRARNKAIRRLVTICATDGRLAACLRELFKRPGKDASLAPFLLTHAVKGLSTSWRFTGMETEVEEFARAALGWQQLPTPPAGWYTVVADVFIEYLDPSKNGGWYAESNAPLVLALFPELRADLGAEDADLILKASDAEKILSPKITWKKSAMKDPAAKDDATDEALPSEGEESAT
jgi:ParB/RepB/Spo0J family partition protein